MLELSEEGIVGHTGEMACVRALEQDRELADSKDDVPLELVGIESGCVRVALDQLGPSLQPGLFGSAGGVREEVSGVVARFAPERDHPAEVCEWIPTRR